MVVLAMAMAGTSSVTSAGAGAHTPPSSGPLSFTDLVSELERQVTDPRRRDPMLPVAGYLPEDCESWNYCPTGSALEAGDLTGDGAEDLFTIERVNDRTTLRARTGLDGSILWSERVEPTWYGAVFLARADVAEDAREEIILLRIDAPYTGVRGPASAFYAELHQTVKVLRPNDGSLVWGRAFEGTYRAGGAWVVGNGVSSVERAVTDFWIVPDATGDGRADVLVEHIESTGAAVALGYGDNVITTREELLRGVDGSTVSTAEWTSNARPFVNPSPDLDGDGLSDLVVMRSVGTSFAVEAYGMAGGLPRWTAPLVGYGDDPWVEGVVLQPDGRADAALWTRNGEDAPFAPIVNVFDGRTGAWRWKTAARDRSNWFRFTPDLTGDGVIDHLEVGRPSNWLEDGPRVRLVSGATGGIAHDSPLELDQPVGDHVSFNPYWQVDDVTGDSLPEVIVDARTSRWDPGTEDWVPQRRIAAAIDPADGQIRWLRDATWWAWLSGVDIDGDAAVELSGHDQGGVEHFIDGATGATVATRMIPEGSWIQFGMAVDGIDGDELLITVPGDDPDEPWRDNGVALLNDQGLMWRIVFA